jgi:hypothetical protein
VHYGSRMANASEHRVTWWVYAGTERIRRTATMRGLWAYDVTCSCGWDSKTGGCVRSYMTQAVADHKWEATL